MDPSWQPYQLDAQRSAQVLLYANATPVEMVTGTATGSVDLSPFATSVRQSPGEANVTVSWHRELDGAAQPAPGQLLEVRLDGAPLWWGVIESINDYRLQRGSRSLTIVARTRDASPLWREVRRVTDVYLIFTPLSYIARQVAYSLGLTDAEIMLPIAAGYTMHANTQMADLSAWDMFEQIYQPSGFEPFIDARGRLKMISRDVTRPADVELDANRVVRVSGARNRRPASVVRIKWLDPQFTRVEQQNQVLARATITAGFFQLTQHQDIFFSDDQSQRAANTYMVVKQSANSGLLDFVDEEYEAKSLTSGLITLTTSVFAPLLATQALATLIALSQVPDGVPGTAVTAPVGRVLHAAAEVELLLIMMCIGTGVYEIQGTPYDFVHARNTTEAYDCDAPEWAAREVEIENDLIGTEDAAQAFAVRELFYQAKSTNAYSVQIVDDPRIEPGDIVRLHDGSRLYVTGYTRDLTRGAAALLDLEGFRV